MNKARLVKREDAARQKAEVKSRPFQSVAAQVRKTVMEPSRESRAGEAEATRANARTAFAALFVGI